MLFAEQVDITFKNYDSCTTFHVKIEYDDGCPIIKITSKDCLSYEDLKEFQLQLVERCSGFWPGDTPHFCFDN